jgi:hypothetical protein
LLDDLSYYAILLTNPVEDGGVTVGLEANPPPCFSARFVVFDSAASWAGVSPSVGRGAGGLTGADLAGAIGAVGTLTPDTLLTNHLQIHKCTPLNYAANINPPSTAQALRSIGLCLTGKGRALDTPELQVSILSFMAATFIRSITLLSEEEFRSPPPISATIPT